MPGLKVSTVLQAVEQLSPSIEGLELHGANLLVARYFKLLLSSPEVEFLEVFLEPAEYIRRSTMAEVAERLLPSERKGTGSLRFYPIHSVEEVWRDADPRLLLSVDVVWLPRDRYLRDAFAAGPMAISCQTHGMGGDTLYRSLAHIPLDPPVRFDAITCLSRACRDSLFRTFDGFLGPAGTKPPLRLEVVPNPVDHERFGTATPASRADARRLLGLPQEGTIALYLGRLSPHGKADLIPLIERFAKASGPEDHLVIAGVENAPGYAARLVAEGADSALGNRLIVRTDVPAWASPLFYRAADLFCFPGDTIQETLGNTILEAMATGLPVIATDWNGFRDTVVDGSTGFLIPTYLLPGLQTIEDLSPAVPYLGNFIQVAQNTVIDGAALEVALTRLLRSPELRVQMGSDGRKRIEELFTWPTVGSRLLGLWSELVNEAANEDPEVQTRRRSNARSLGMPLPYRHLFEPYATQLVEAERASVRLSDKGSAILAGRQKLGFYDETLPLVHQPVVDGIFNRLLSDRSTWRSMSQVAREVSESTGIKPDSVLYHLGLLIKRGAIDLKPGGV